VDVGGDIIVADTDNHCIRLITPQGQVSTLAGTGVKGYQDGEWSNALFCAPYGVAVDKEGNIIVADLGNHRIRLITPQGQVSTLAGNGEEGYQDGEGTVAQFRFPVGVAVDGGGNIIVADTENNCIRLITPQDHVSTLAGTGEQGHQDGEGTVAKFDLPSDIAVDRDGNIIVADTMNRRIRKITPQGQVSTLAGTGEEGHRDGEGTDAQFEFPSGVAVDGDGNVVVADNHRIRLITPQGQVSTLAGTGEEGYRDGEGIDALFNSPSGVAVDEEGNIVVADEHNHRVRRVVSGRGVTIPPRESTTMGCVTFRFRSLFRFRSTFCFRFRFCASVSLSLSLPFSLLFHSSLVFHRSESEPLDNRAHYVTFQKADFSQGMTVLGLRSKAKRRRPSGNKR
jgi:DNA-binding beta-propeller fold protein YncE